MAGDLIQKCAPASGYHINVDVHNVN